MKRFYFLAMAFLVLAVAVPVAWGGRCFGGRCSIQSAPVETWTYSPVSFPRVVGPSGHAMIGQAQTAPAQAAALPGSTTNPPTGVVGDKLSHGPSYLQIGGQSIGAAAEPVGRDDLPEDAGKAYILIVGDKDFQARGKEALQGLPDARECHQGFFSPVDWQVAGVSLERPGVSILGPKNADGSARALHYQSDLAGLEKPIASVVGALRKRNPDFDGLKVPDLRNVVDGIKSRLLAGLGLDLISPMLAGMGLVGVGLVAAKKGVGR